MIPVAAEIIFNWIAMGIVLTIVMISCLYFAVLCEKIVDFLFSR